MPEAPVPPSPFYTVNFADDDGNPTTSRLTVRDFATRDQAQKYVDERRRALEELEWSVVIVDHAPTETEEEES